VGYPRAAMVAHRSVTHVRHYRGAEQERRQCQCNQVPPHTALPHPHLAVVYNCRVSHPHDCQRVKVRDQRNEVAADEDKRIMTAVTRQILSVVEGTEAGNVVALSFIICGRVHPLRVV
jgi:hypothetical protein